MELGLRGREGEQEGGAHTERKDKEGDSKTELSDSSVTFSFQAVVPEKSCSLVQFSHSVLSDSLRPHGLQHTSPPCPSPTPGAYSNSCPLRQWCHPTISSSLVPFSSHLHLSQHQNLFQWVSSLHHVAKVLEFQLHHQSFQWTLRTDLLSIYKHPWMR